MPDFRWKLKYQSSYEAPTSTGGGEFTNDGLHYSDETLEALAAYIINN
ncbi:MAG: hypothetical protein IIT42_03055 [Clostridia bacterium]|nr:hypothetical protein [Clostridia bacterium]